ncbi:hypothetical protein CERSUDRAFT_117388 [Gelatoporia subvermispora B]|uniref:DUF2415 domain-containing protein n=1 Tax=Ceriporiopsis subvermispora (strain B) TaxID=914234 RepID=M2R6L3_CERS8|nr:hypothetical protein CERSUDRAFT_117388 [Gelatoporia subvermispora B]
MARGGSTLLSSHIPCTVAPAQVTIGHVQLRDVLICPHEKGIVCYPYRSTLVEHDLLLPRSAPRKLVELTFVPNSLTSLILEGTGDTLVAAGGQEAELHLSYYASSPSTGRDDSPLQRVAGFGHKEWETKYVMDHGSINNSVLLTSLSLTGSHESSAEPRVVVSNNDKTVNFFDVAVRSARESDDGAPKLHDAGQLRLDVAVNHSSISPDGRTLLSVGDSPDVYLHRLTGGAHITCAPISTLSLSPYIQNTSFNGLSYASTVPASFSTAFSGDGSKFAVASQEGVVVVWDVRSTKPLKVLQTDKSNASRAGSGGASGWLYDMPWDWSRSQGRAPGWGVRSVKFSPQGVGREVMTFTEHTSLLHVVDTRTFETEEIVRVPSFDAVAARQPSMRPRSISPRPPLPTVPSSLSPEPLPPPPPRIVLFSGALEDTFRIPSSDPPSSASRRRPRLGRRLLSRDDMIAEDDVDGIVLIPPLGDREVEQDVRRLLGHHGLRTRTLLDVERERDNYDEHERERERERDREPGEGPEEEMDVDELESDCFSSHTPSRASSPAPVPSTSNSVPVSAPTPASTSARGIDALRAARPGLLARRESAGPYLSRRGSSGLSRRHRRNTTAEEEPDQDLAGMCFDPSGTCVYVASMRGVAEWKVRGAEQRWWTDPTWA